MVIWIRLPLEAAEGTDPQKLLGLMRLFFAEPGGELLWEDTGLLVGEPELDEQDGGRS